MDWGELVEQAKSNPEIQAIIDRMGSGASKEGAAEMQPMIDKVARQGDLETAFNNGPTPTKSAQESAQVFQSQPETPNFVMQGAGTGFPPDAPPNFRLQGEPYSGNVPETVPKVSGVPAIRESGQVPEALARDVTPSAEATTPEAPKSELNAEDQSKWLSEEGGGSPEAETGKLSRQPLSRQQKIALGAGGIGAGLIGAKMLQQDEEEQPPNQEDLTNKQNAAIASISGEKQEAKPQASQEEAEEDNTDEQDLEHGSTKTPKDSVPSDKLSQVKAAMDKLLNFGSADQNKDNLADLLAQQQKQVKMQQFLRAGALFGAGMARVNPNLGVYDQAIKESGLPVQQYELKQKYADEDPNSGISKGMRDYVKQNLGVNVSDGATAAQMKSVLPMIYKNVEAQQAQAAKLQQVDEQQATRRQQMQIAQLNHQDNLARIQAAKDLNRQDKQTQQGQAQYNKGIQQAESVRGNRAIQADMTTLNRVQNAMTTIKQYPNPNDIPAPILSTFDADLATIMTGGNAPGEGVIKDVTDPSVQKDLAQFWSKWSNQPQGARAAAFVQQKGNILQALGKDADHRIKERYKRIGNTMGMGWSPEQKEAYRSEYLPNYNVDASGRFVPDDELSDKELKQKWLQNQQNKGNVQ